MVGRPHPSGGVLDTPGIFNSLITSRTPANSPTPLLLNRLTPNRKSLTSAGDSVRVLETIACQGSFKVFPPFKFTPGDRLTSLPQLYRPNQLEFTLSTKSMRWLNWSLSMLEFLPAWKFWDRLAPGWFGCGRNCSI